MSDSKVIWFFGDSWPAGCELDPNGQDNPAKAFPGIIGQKLNLEIQNKGTTGTSQERMIELFLESNIQSKDLVIFCCTAKTRRLYRTASGKIAEIQFQTDETYVNAYEDERISSHCCALLYYLAMSRGAIPYFFNLFDCVRYPDSMYAEIPEANWLIPKTESVLSYLFDPVFFHKWNHHHNGNFHEWLKTESTLVNTYIRPCRAHPNQVGHETIANFIIDQLKNRGQFV